MQQIEDTLHRRTDLSTFLVHLTRDREVWTAKEILQSIYDQRILVARSPMGWAKEQDDPNDQAAQSQRVVCFSETPLEHAWALTAEIAGRQVRLEPYGVALPKRRARRLGVNPVWYVDMTEGRDRKLAHALDKLRENAVASGDFHHQPAARVFPFIESMGSCIASKGTVKEFWCEREWRHVGALFIPTGAIFLCPENEIDEFVQRRADEEESDWNRRKRSFVDPTWGLERIIAHLAGTSKEDVTPF
jgi:hypothetical protein